MEAIGLLPSDVEEDSTTTSSITHITDCKLPFLKIHSKNERFDSGFDSGGLDNETREKELSDKFSSILSLDKERHLPRQDYDRERKSPIESLTYPEIYFNSDEDGDTPLHLMVIHGNPDYVSSICHNCQDRSYLDSVNNLHQTPLHLAVLMNQPLICQNLIDYNATIDLRDRNGQTPLHIACEHGLIECVKILTKTQDVYLQNRSKSHQDLELMNYEGFTCFHLAVMGGYMDIIKHLCDLKANVNAQDGKSGRTALHYAVEAQNEKLIRLLVNYRANIDITTYAGLTPERLAKGRGYDNIHACLKELGAEEELDEDMSDDYSSDYDDLTFEGNPLVVM